MWASVGQKIRIKFMDGEPEYNGKEGVVTHIDDVGHLHGTWGGLSICPDLDDFIVIEDDEEK